MRDWVAVGHNSAEIFVEGEVRSIANLEPDTTYHFDHVEFTTLADVGRRLATVVTMNDVHFGEIECGKIVGVTEAAFRVQDGERPYPEIMNEAVIADAQAVFPDVVIVKGDLTSFGTLEEYQSFKDFYLPAFGDRLVYVRGNHDSYPGLVFADWPVQVIDVEGLRVILLDTSRSYESGGFLSTEQIEATITAAAAVEHTVIVMGHHPLFVPGVDRVQHFDGVRPDDSAALLEAMTPHKNIVAYSAGHTHRSRRRDVAGIAVIEVACVKDFPGAWAEYVVGTQGVSQIVHRASSPEAIAWAEKTSTMFDGYYGNFAMGELSDRCFVLPRRR